MYVAIKADPTNIDLILASCNLYEQLGQVKKAVDGYRLVLRRMPPGNGEKYLQIARDVAMVSGEITMGNRDNRNVEIQRATMKWVKVSLCSICSLPQVRFDSCFSL